MKIRFTALARSRRQHGFSLLEMLLVAIALILGYVGSSIFIGDKIFISTRKHTIPFFNAVIGIVVLYLVGFIPIVGNVVKALFLLAGFGAVMTTRFGTARLRSSARAK